MREAITQEMIERMVKRINAATITDPVSGHFELASAYGGWRLEHISALGGCEDAMGTGFVPKRELFNAMHIFLRGIQIGRGTK